MPFLCHCTRHICARSLTWLCAFDRSGYKLKPASIVFPLYMLPHPSLLLVLNTPQADKEVVFTVVSHKDGLVVMKTCKPAFLSHYSKDTLRKHFDFRFSDKIFVHVLERILRTLEYKRRQNIFDVLLQTDCSVSRISHQVSCVHIAISIGLRVYIITLTCNISNIVRFYEDIFW